MTPGIGDEIKPPFKNGESKLNKLEEKLYSPTTFIGSKPRKSLGEHNIEAEGDWNDGNLDSMLSQTTPKKGGVNWFAIFTLIAFLFFAGAVSYGYLKFTSGGGFASDSNIELLVTGPVSVGGGEELALDILVQNNNATPIETVDLVIEYPDGTKQANDLKSDLPRIREGLGIIEANQLVKRTHSAALFGEEGSSKNIKVRVEYRLPGSTAIFEETKEYGIILKSSPIRLVVNSVKEITSNQELSFDVSITSNSPQDLENIILKAQYPFGFVFEESTLKPSDGSDTWIFDRLRPNEEKKFTITGQLSGQDTEERIFKFNAGIADEEDQKEIGIVFTTLPKSVTISQPFLGISLEIDGNSDQVTNKKADRPLESIMTLRNNTDTNVRDVNVSLVFSGNVLDESEIKSSDGFYRSSDNSLIWNSSDVNALKEIPAGSVIRLPFTLRPLPLASQAGAFAQPEIIINAKATGLRVSETSVPEKIEATTFRRIRFESEVELASSVVHVSGPLPPKVENETIYEVTLVVSNSSNELSNAKVTANLPTYVSWLDSRSPSSADLKFDQVSKILEWKIGEIEPRAGFGNPSKTLKFRIGITPSLSQVASTPILLKDLRFSGIDSFTGNTIDLSIEDQTIINNDNSFGNNDSGVVQ